MSCGPLVGFFYRAKFLPVYLYQITQQSHTPSNYISYSTSTSSSRLLIEFFQYIDAVAHFFMSNIDNFRRQKINTTAIMNKDFMIHAICWLLFITCYLLLIIIWYLESDSMILAYLKLAISCKKIVSFRSCSATRSCFFYKNKVYKKV